jgi:hypothetical protein
MITIIAIAWLALSIPVGLVLWACCVVSARADAALAARK